MAKHTQVVDAWYIQHPRIVRLLFAALMVTLALMLFIGSAHPAHAATPGPIIQPPKSGDVTVPDAVVTIIGRIFAFLLILIGLVAAVGFLWNVGWILVAVFGTHNRDAIKVRGRNIIVTVIIGGLTFGGAYSIFNATAEAAGKIFG